MTTRAGPMIGQSWLDALADDGRRRLEDPRTFSPGWCRRSRRPWPRRHCDPVLVAGARMPTPPSGPGWSHSASQAISLRHESFAPHRHPRPHEQAVPTGSESATGVPRDRNRGAGLVNAGAAAR